MCHQFGVTGSPAIPADFFGMGSDPFTGSVCLEGTPLGPTQYGDFGTADTLIARSADPFDMCDPVSATQSTVSIDVAELSLVSTTPIVVSYDGGQTLQTWDVAVDLSPGSTPPAGTLTAIKTHCNGGTYTSTLHVQPRFTFTRTDDPQIVAVLDTGLEGYSPITLDQSVPAPWVHRLDYGLVAPNDGCSVFRAGIEDPTPSTNCTCSDTNLCTSDGCDPLLGCVFNEVFNAAVECCNPDTGQITTLDDSNACTTDICVAGAAEHEASFPPDYCCDVITGSLTFIDDAMACTDDICNVDGSVEHIANCTEPQQCLEATGECGIQIPTVSQWGVAVMALLVLMAGTLVVRPHSLMRVP